MPAIRAAWRGERNSIEEQHATTRAPRMSSTKSEEETCDNFKFEVVATSFLLIG